MNPLYQTDLPTLGRNTDIDHHADLQVLQRIKRFLLPRDFEVSKDLLQQMQQGYGIADQPVDALLSSGIKFAKPLQQKRYCNSQRLRRCISSFANIRVGMMPSLPRLAQLPIGAIR